MSQRRLRFHTRATACALLLANLAFAQSTIVSGGGTALQQAIAAAVPGEVLVVRPATYTAIVIDKALTVLCDPGVTVLDGTAWAVQIQNLAAGQTVILRDLAVDSRSQRDTIRIANCAGAVILDGTTDASSLGSGLIDGCTGPVLVYRFTATTLSFLWTVTNCSHVGFHDSPALPSISVSNSGLHIGNSTSQSNQSQHNNPPVAMWGSTVAITGCALTGQTSLAGIMLQHPAIFMRGGQLTIAGGSSLTPPSFSVPYSPGIDAIGGTIELSDETQVAGTPPITPGVVVRSNERLPAVRATGAASSTRFTAQIDGEVGSLTATLAGAPLSPAALPPFGIAWIDPGSPVLDIGIVPTSGTRTAGLTVPTLPTATPILLQSVSLTSSGAIVVGPPKAVLLN